MIKTRVREFRKRRRLTLEQLAEQAEISVSQLSRIETGGRGWSMDSLPKIARALGVEVVELIDASKAWNAIPVHATVGREGVIRAAPNGQSSMIVDVPTALGEVLVLMVVDASQYPRYMDGDMLICSEDPVRPEFCLNRECMVTLESGISYLRQVQAGSEPGRFNLVTHNMPPMLSVNIVACRPVLHVNRA